MKPKPGTPSAVLPAEEDTPIGSGGETSSVAWQVPVEEHFPLGGVTPAPFPSASVATESDGAGVNVWSESESKGVTSEASSPVLSAKTDSATPVMEGGHHTHLRASPKIREKNPEAELSKDFRKLTASLGLAEENWFWNYRMKSKKEHQG